MPKRRSEALENASKYYEVIMKQRQTALAEEQQIRQQRIAVKDDSKAKVETNSDLPDLQGRRQKVSARKSVGSSDQGPRGSTSRGSTRRTPTKPDSLKIARGNDKDPSAPDINDDYDQEDHEETASAAPPSAKRLRLSNPPPNSNPTKTLSAVAGSGVPRSNRFPLPGTEYEADEARPGLSSHYGSLAKSSSATHQQPPQHRTPPRPLPAAGATAARDSSANAEPGRFGTANGNTNGSTSTTSFEKPPFGSPLPGGAAAMRRQRTSASVVVAKPTSSTAGYVAPPHVHRSSNTKYGQQADLNSRRRNEDRAHLFSVMQGVNDLSTAIRTIEEEEEQAQEIKNKEIIDGEDNEDYTDDEEEDDEAVDEDVGKLEVPLNPHQNEQVHNQRFSLHDTLDDNEEKEEPLLNRIFSPNVRLILFSLVIVSIPLSIFLLMSYFLFQLVVFLPGLITTGANELTSMLGIHDWWIMMMGGMVGNSSTGLFCHMINSNCVFRPPCYADSAILPDLSKVTVEEKLLFNLSDDSLQADFAHSGFDSGPIQCRGDGIDGSGIIKKLCPVGGRCYGGILLECSSRNNYFIMSANNSTCLLTEAALDHIRSMKVQLHGWNVNYYCSNRKSKQVTLKETGLDGVSPVWKSTLGNDSDESDSEGKQLTNSVGDPDGPLFFRYYFLTEHLQINPDLELLEAANTNGSLFVLSDQYSDGNSITDDQILIGLHPNVQIAIPLLCRANLWMHYFLNAFARLVWTLIVVVATGFWQLFWDAPLVVTATTIIGSTVITVMHYIQAKRVAKKQLELDVINLRHKVCSELSSHPGVAVPTHLICERIAWKDYPASRAKREYISKILWPFVVNDIRTDTRIARIKKRMANDDSVICEHWQWMDVTSPVKAPTVIAENTQGNSITAPAGLSLRR